MGWKIRVGRRPLEGEAKEYGKDVVGRAAPRSEDETDVTSHTAPARNEHLISGGYVK